MPLVITDKKKTPWTRWASQGMLQVWTCMLWAFPTAMLPMKREKLMPGSDCLAVTTASREVTVGRNTKFLLLLPLLFDSRSHTYPWIPLSLLFPNSSFH
jgi:hypothetical protein